MRHFACVVHSAALTVCVALRYSKGLPSAETLANRKRIAEEAAKATEAKFAKKDGVEEEGEEDEDEDEAEEEAEAEEAEPAKEEEAPVEAKEEAPPVEEAVDAPPEVVVPSATQADA